MSTAVSPLAPEHFPDMPPIDGVRLATAAAGIRYPGRTDVLLALLRPGHDGSRRVHALEMPVRAGRLVPRAAQAAAAARRAGGQFRQRQRLHRQVRPRGDASSPPKIAAQAAGCRPSRGFSGLDRRDRRAARCHQVRRRDGSAGRKRRARRLARRRQGDHDHRHLPEGRGRHGAARHQRRSRSAASPRAPA